VSFVELVSQPLTIATATLLVISAAAGISFYLTLGALGLASRLALIPALPPGLSGLEHPVVIATAAGLLLVEALADREPAFAGMWHTLHAIVKPLATALLAASALAGRPVGTVVGACALAGLTALVFHGIRYGARVARRMPNAPVGGALVILAEAVLALALLVAVRFREAAVPTAAGLVLIALVAGPLGLRAFRLGVSAQRARMRALLGRSGWSDLDRLPRSLQAAVPATPIAGTPPRAMQVGVLRAPGFGRFSRAWLVSDTEGHRLLCRSLLGRRHYAIPGSPTVTVIPGGWADAVEIDAEAEKLRILLLKDGPAPALVARSLAPEPLSAGRVDNS
jgi:hypothetical protein